LNDRFGCSLEVAIESNSRGMDVPTTAKMIRHGSDIDKGSTWCTRRL
jgi:hypothetical protein